MDDFKEEILKFLKKEAKLEDAVLEVPPNPEMGDYAFPCFVLAKEWKKPPNDIAKELSQKFRPTKSVNEARAIGPYLNFFVNKGKITLETINDIIRQKGKYGSSGIGKGKKILLEHTSINPNASPHVGRARNAIIGDSIARTLRFLGNKVETHYYVNDVSKHVAILAMNFSPKDRFENMLEKY